MVKMKSVFAVLLMCAAAFAAADDWVLAAKEFTFSEESSSRNVNQNLTSILPALVMEKISQNFSRTTTNEELLNRALSTYLTGRQSLFLSLSSAVKKRDSLVLTESNERSLRRALATQDEAIADIKTQIDDNLAATRRVREEYTERTSGGFESDKSPLPFNPFRNLFVTSDETLLPEIQEEDVAFYKDDVHTIFTLSDEAAKEGILSRAADKEITAASVNALLDGVITVYGDYFSAECILYNFPGAVVLGEVTEVGAVSDIVDVAENIANYFIPLIANKETVDIYFSIGPADILQDTMVVVDSDVHNGVPDKITVSTGRHSIQIECEGYITRSIVYNFAGAPAYLIKGDMREEKSFIQGASVAGDKEGSVYLGTDLAGDITEESRDLVFTLNGAAEIGQFQSAEDSNSLFFFYVPQMLEQMERDLIIKGAAVNHSQTVDRRRIITYRAYSAFVISVPVTLALMSQATSLAIAYNAGRYSDRQAAVGWQVAGYTSLGVTIGLGVFWGFELVRYLMAANSLLPYEAKADNSYAGQ